MFFLLVQNLLWSKPVCSVTSLKVRDCYTSEELHCFFSVFFPLWVVLEDQLQTYSLLLDLVNHVLYKHPRRLQLNKNQRGAKEEGGSFFIFSLSEFLVSISFSLAFNLIGSTVKSSGSIFRPGPCPYKCFEINFTDTTGYCKHQPFPFLTITVGILLFLLCLFSF